MELPGKLLPRGHEEADPGLCYGSALTQFPHPQQGGAPGRAGSWGGAGRQQRVPPILPLTLKPLIVLYPLTQLWEVSSGELLLSVLFDVGIMAVTLDLSEYHMFCGGMDGSIFQVDLCAWVSVWGCRSAGCCSEPPSPPRRDWCDRGVGGSGFPRVTVTR